MVATLLCWLPAGSLAPSDRHGPGPEGLSLPLRLLVFAVPSGLGCRGTRWSQGRVPCPRVPWAKLAPQPAEVVGPCLVGRAELLPGGCTLPQPIPIHQSLGFSAVLSPAAGAQGWWAEPPPPPSPPPAWVPRCLT